MKITVEVSVQNALNLARVLQFLPSYPGIRTYSGSSVSEGTEVVLSSMRWWNRTVSGDGDDLAATPAWIISVTMLSSPSYSSTYIELSKPLKHKDNNLTKTSCAARWPPQYAPAPWPWLLTLKSAWESHVTWGTPVESFVFLRLLVFKLEPMYATSDRWTDDRRRWPPNATASPTGAGA